MQLAWQAPQTVSAFAVHAADGYVPAAQVEHVLHWPLSRYLPAPQLAHCVLAGPVQVAQLASHWPQARSAFAVQVEIS